jgi:phosphate/sulfate permease
LSVLTKIFVVLVTLLSVALVAAVVPFVANTENYRERFEQENTARKIAQGTAVIRQRQLNEERSVRQAEAMEWKQKVERLEGQIGDLLGTQARIRAEMLQKDFDLDKLRASDTKIRSSNDLQTRTISAQNAELIANRRNVREQAQRLVGLEQRRSELENENEFLLQQMRYLKEQLVALQEGKEDLQNTMSTIPLEIRQTYTGATMDDQMPILIDPPHKIEGMVTGVMTGGEETFVEINVGRTDGVQERMRFFVSRGEQYVGTLMITTMGDRNAAGPMQIIQQDHQVRQGDVVAAHPPN